MATSRARSNEDKAGRCADIVAAALDVFDASEVDEFTMEAVATKLGLAKGTLYRYFPTREGLLLSLAAAELLAWFERVEHRIATLDDPESIAGRLVDEVLAEPRFMRLMSLVPSVLERNIPFDTAFAYKSAVVERSATTVDLLASRLGVPRDRARRLLVQLQAMTVGLYHVAHPAPIIAEVMADPRFAGSAFDERDELVAAVTALVAAARQP